MGECLVLLTEKEGAARGLARLSGLCRAFFWDGQTRLFVWTKKEDAPRARLLLEREGILYFSDS